MKQKPALVKRSLYVGEYRVKRHKKQTVGLADAVFVSGIVCLLICALLIGIIGPVA